MTDVHAHAALEAAAAARPDDVQALRERAEKAEEKAEWARGIAGEWEIHVKEVNDYALKLQAQIVELTVRAEKAEAARDTWEQYWKEDNETYNADLREVRALHDAQVAALTAKLDEALSFIKERGAALDDAIDVITRLKNSREELTRKLDEARGVLRDAASCHACGYCPICDGHPEEDVKHAPGCRLAAVIAPETGKETR